MVLNFRVECILDCNRDDFWKLRTHPDFLNHLVQCNALRRVTFSDIAPHDDGSFSRVLKYVPQRLNIPEFVVSMIGDEKFELVDTQRWVEPAMDGEPGAGEGTTGYSLDFSVRANLGVWSDVVSTRGTAVFEELEEAESDAGDGVGEDTALREQCRHTIDVQVAVGIFGVGGYLEANVKENMKTFYRDYPNVVTSFRNHVVRTVCYPEVNLVSRTGDQVSPQRPQDEQRVCENRSSASSSTDGDEEDRSSDDNDDLRKAAEQVVIPDGMTFSAILDAYFKLRRDQVKQNEAARQASDVPEVCDHREDKVLAK